MCSAGQIDCLQRCKTKRCKLRHIATELRLCCVWCPTVGIELRGRDRRTRGIDYNAEVAFEKKPVPGFYDTGDEVRQTREMQQEFRPTTVEEMEGKRRKVSLPVVIVVDERV